jgi:hypothetical protein
MAAGWWTTYMQREIETPECRKGEAMFIYYKEWGIS